MPPHEQTANGKLPAQEWRPDLIFKVLGEPLRRSLVFALARQPWQSPSQLKHILERTVDGTMKRLFLMRSNGIVIMKPDTVDLRRQLFSLVPEISVVATEKGKLLDLGYLKVPLTGASDAERNGVRIDGTLWMPQVVYSAMSDPARRKLLVILTRTPAQTGDQLARQVGLKQDATLKHLVVLRKAGFVNDDQSDERDGRRQLYSLAPALPLEIHADRVLFEFGFCTIRLP